MLLPLVLLACWGDPTPPVVTDPLVTTVPGPALPPPPRRGIDEVATPATIVRATDVVDNEPPVRLDVQVNFDNGTFGGVQSALTGWGFTIVDGDGQVLRVDGAGGDNAMRLVGLPEVARVTPVLDRNTLPDGTFRNGSETYGAVKHTWRWPNGAPVEETVTGATIAQPELPDALPAGARSCFEPLMDDLTMGVSVGVGWERALDTSGGARWAVVLEGYGACDAKGWMVLAPKATVEGVTFGGRTVAESDETHFQDLATAWLAKPQPDLDPGVLAAVQLLAGADNAVLARAVREAWPGPAQVQLLEAFTSRDPEAALSIAGGATSPILRAQALGQDEDARKKVLADPAAKPSELAAALSGWRPGANDAAALERFLGSPDPAVRARAWEAKFASTATSCAGRDPTKDPAAVYAECPASRVVVVTSLRKSDAAAAEKLVAGTLAAPETVETGVAAVRQAVAAGLWGPLVACVESLSVSRDVRGVALRAIVDAGRPEAADLAARHGSFLGLPKQLIPFAGAGAAPAVADPSGAGK